MSCLWIMSKQTNCTMKAVGTVSTAVTEGPKNFALVKILAKKNRQKNSSSHEMKCYLSARAKLKLN